MKLFLVERTDNVGYIQWRNLVVRVEKEEDIYNLIKDKYGTKKDNYKVSELNIDGEEIIVIEDNMGA